ncbi:2'-5' RNA ligase [Sphingobium fontiphilum]|uniref:2'-5' RNA ligase n=2 Tax=Sphingobium fontiphilum TaxID=944425 RepID=A0A7W6GNF9_9SPHN|nr:2'-5' RNA ligase [Sphingobium fontiphilum]
MFDARGYPDALWAGVEPHEPLAHLHRKIDRMCVRCGLASERRAYLPHMTLARMGRAAGPVTPFLAENAGLSLPAFTVSTVTLFESHLSHNGAIYRQAAQYPAQGS